MKTAMVACCALFLLGTAHAAGKPHACAAPRGMIARAAYVPAMHPAQCAQLLSTGTILTPRRWNKT